jgi:hypothetical protein
LQTGNRKKLDCSLQQRFLPETGIGAMGGYRLYYVGPDGHFIGVEEIEADDDDGATKAARKFAGARPMELWDAARQVKTFPATPPGG